MDEGTEPRHNCYWSYQLLWTPDEGKESIGPNLGLLVSNRLAKKAINFHYPLIITIISFALNLLSY